jgi:hypothetical protein
MTTARLKSTWAAIGRHAIDGLPGDEYIALARLLETGDHAQRRRLAASGGAEKRQEFACTDPKVDAIGGDDLTEPLGDATELDDCRFGRQGRRSCF